MKKSLAVAILAVCSLTIASAKSYDIILSGPTKAGTVELKPGQYKLKVEGTNAVFTDVNSTKSFTTPVKVESADQKYDETRVQTTKEGDEEHIQEIDLGGSKTKLGF
jgi:hypothetical protein